MYYNQNGILKSTTFEGTNNMLAIQIDKIYNQELIFQSTKKVLKTSE